LLEDAFALERVGVGIFDVKLHCERVAHQIADQRGKAGAATAFFGYDPFGLSNFRKAANLEECVLDELLALERRGVYPTRFRPVAGALYTAFYADSLGVDLVGGGPTSAAAPQETTTTSERAHPTPSLLEAVLKSGLPLVRAAYGQSQEWDAFLDQLLCVGAVLDCCSNFGDLQLRAWLVPDEYAVVVDPRTLRTALDRRDHSAVADIARFARLFLPGDARAGAVVEEAVPFLLSSNFQPRAEESLPYTRFRAQADAVRALHEPEHRGFGPSLPGLRDVLKSLNPRVANVDAFAPNGVKLASTRQADALLASAYAGAGRPPDAPDADDDDDDGTTARKTRSLREKANHHLGGILKFKTLTDGTARFDFPKKNGNAQQPQPKRRRTQQLR